MIIIRLIFIPRLLLIYWPLIQLFKTLLWQQEMYDCVSPVVILRLMPFCSLCPFWTERRAWRYPPPFIARTIFKSCLPWLFILSTCMTRLSFLMASITTVLSLYPSLYLPSQMSLKGELMIYLLAQAYHQEEYVVMHSFTPLGWSRNIHLFWL